MTKKMKQWLDELRKQDKQFSQLMEERRKIREEAEEAGVYDELYNYFYKDGQPHWDF